MIEQSDDYLVNSFKAGNDWALAAIYDRYRQTIILEAFYILQDAYEAEDVAQEVFLWLLKNRTVLSIKSTSLFAYLKAAVRHLCYDRLRHNKVVQDYASAYRYLTDSSTKEDTVENKELVSALLSAIASMSAPTAARVVTEKYLYEKRHAEIASQLGISVQVVRNQMSHALRILRKKLKHLK